MITTIVSCTAFVKTILNIFDLLKKVLLNNRFASLHAFKDKLLSEQEDFGHDNCPPLPRLANSRVRFLSSQATAPQEVFVSW